MEKFNLIKMATEDIEEYQQLVKMMADDLTSTEISRKGQNFHQKVSQKYGQGFAAAMSEAMMDDIYLYRINRALREYNTIDWDKEIVYGEE